MSFLSERKSEIMDFQYKNACCRRALLNGVIFSKGELSDGEISIRLENQKIAEYISRSVKEFFGKETAFENSTVGGRFKKIIFKSPACEKYLLALSENELPYFTEKCSFCKSAFLRGIFLGCGRVTNPQKQYRIEFSPVNRHNELANFLFEHGMKFSVTERRRERVLYTGNSTVAEDFFAAIGMNSTTFMLMNSKIESEFKNAANRIRNCETNNILKTVSASARWVEAIEALEKASLLSTLPEELEKTARLRLQYRDYSLARLAAEFTPPISKSGLSHRLNKIVEMSETLLGKK